MIRRLWALGCRTVLLLAGGLFAFSAAMLGVQIPAVGWIALAAAAWRICRRGWQVTGAYGTAKAGTLYDAIRHKMLCDSGLILGKLGDMARPTRGQALRSLLSFRVPSEWAVRLCFSAFLGVRRPDDFIRIKDFVHLLTVAPPSAGKTTGVLAPNLLSYPGNCVVVDPKGELCLHTAEHRRRKFGHRSVRLDPALLLGPGADCFNPFDWIDPRGKDFVEHCRDLANMMVLRTGSEHELHWLDSAENVLAAFIAYVCACEGNPAARNLRGMRSFIGSRANYTDALAIMQQNEGFYGILQQFGHSLTWHVDRELGSVMSTTQRQSNVFDFPLVDDSTSSSSFDPAELRSGRMTIYLIVPGDRLTVWAPLLRVWLGSILRIATRGVPTEKNPVLFLIDEAAHIGKMQVLEDAVTLLRGSGIRLWFFFQSLDQLNKCFGDRASTVLDSLATQQYFAITSYDTAEAISKRIGDETIAVRTEGGNEGTSRPFGGDGKAGGSRTTGTSDTIQETSRRLLKPEEILTLPGNVSLLFHKNNYVMVRESIKYYADSAFRKRWWRGYGTGRSRGLGLSGMVLALTVLAVAGMCTAFVTGLPVAGGGRPGAFAPGRFFNGGSAGNGSDGFRNTGPNWQFDPWRQPPEFQPAPYRPDGSYPLPYRRTRRSYR